MRTRQVLLVVICVACLAAPAAWAQPEPCTPKELPTCEVVDPSESTGAKILICKPEPWNGKLVAYAHGYVAASAPLQFANLSLPDGTCLPTLVQQLGFGFATTTYRQNGLAIVEGVDDVIDAVEAFTMTYGPPDATYMTGASEGGLVATLAAQEDPVRFTAAYALCGPIGDFRFQLNYVGDFRVLFDYFFPGLIPGSAVDVPAWVQANWDTVYAPAIQHALARRPARAKELLRVARAPHDPGNPATILQTALGLLWYNVFGTEDAKSKLSGNPYDNRFRWYTGSSNDLLLNLRVRRFSADPIALLKLQAYTPTGDLRIPLVALHTTSDEIVPFAHELIYGVKVRPTGRGHFLPLPILRYGHCAFTKTEVLLGFALMLGSGVGAASDQPVATVLDPLVQTSAVVGLGQQ